jgi:hypothetical protein
MISGAVAAMAVPPFRAVETLFAMPAEGCGDVPNVGACDQTPETGPILTSHLKGAHTKVNIAQNSMSFIRLMPKTWLNSARFQKPAEKRFEEPPGLSIGIMAGPKHHRHLGVEIGIVLS